jgi:excisionase family DNA binding protein
LSTEDTLQRTGKEIGMSTVEIVLKHLVPALEAIRMELQREKRMVPVSTSEPPRAPNPAITCELSSKKHLLNMDEVCERLSISKSTLYRLTSERRIPFYKIGGRVLFSEEILQEWIEKRRVDAH